MKMLFEIFDNLFLSYTKKIKSIFSKIDFALETTFEVKNQSIFFNIKSVSTLQSPKNT